jgi:MFS family permease
VPLRTDRDFRRLWASQTLSEVGSQATMLTVPLLVLYLTSSAEWAGVVGAAASVTRLLLRLPAGLLIDRLDRRRLMMSCEAARAAAMGLLGIAVLSHVASPWLIMLAVVVEAAGYVLFSAAERVILRHLVEPTELAAASASNEARGYVAGLLGPPAGGVLFGLSRSAPFLGDALSYLLSFGAVALIGKPLREARAPADADWRRSLRQGWRFVRAQPFLRAVALFVPILNLAYAGTVFVTVLALQRAGLPAGLIGLVQAMTAVGGLLGAGLAPRLLARTPPHHLIVVLCCLMTAGVAGCALLAPSPWLAAPLPLLTLLIPSVNAAVFAQQTVVTPDHLYGRVISLLILLSSVMAPVAPAAGGVLVTRAGATWAFTCFAACLAVATLIASRSKGLRTIGTPQVPSTDSSHRE